jgi:hypothetical protein
MKHQLAKVGEPWDGGDIKTWPGVSGTQGVSNHLSQNTNPFLPDPLDTNGIHIKGGGRKSIKSRKSNKKSIKKSRKSRKHKKSIKKSRKSRKHKKSRKKSRKTFRRSRKIYKGGSHHGGTLMPQSLVDLWRDGGYQLEKGYSAITGDNPPVNPNPTEDQYKHF